MRYADLDAQTTKLTVGKHLIYEQGTNAVFIENIGQRNPALPNHSVYRLVVRLYERKVFPRHSDLFRDLQLKIEARPDLRLPLLESCEQVSSGEDPLHFAGQRRLPRYFREPSETEWGHSTTQLQTAGLPTELFLCTLQGFILTCEHNNPEMNAPEMFRHAFNRILTGDSILETAIQFVPRTPVGKRYYDLSMHA
jgi:hypothetical protein